MTELEPKSLHAEPLTHCPLCHAALDPLSPGECPKCDWVAGYRQRSFGGTQRDKAAAALSVIPGLGHIYKGHYLLGAILMIGGAFAVLACTIAATASAGFGLLLAPIYWIGVILQVYWIEDRRAPR